MPFDLPVQVGRKEETEDARPKAGEGQRDPTCIPLLPPPPILDWFSSSPLTSIVLSKDPTLLRRPRLPATEQGLARPELHPFPVAPTLQF